MGCASSKGAKNVNADGIRSHMVRERKGAKVEDLYETISTIGRGSVGMISRVRYRQTGQEYALKTIQLEKISSKLAKEMRNEIEILKRLDHPNIIRAIETFEANRRVYLVMKLCTGGDLHSRKPYTEKAVANIITKLLSATWYMHNEGIVHRDLKLENVVFESKAPDADIFIIDYGLSKIIDTSARMKEVVGTLYTMAPEVLKGSGYDSSCDMWSIGAMAFVLLSGDMPFDFRTKQRLIKSVEDGRYEFSGRRWDHISGDARTFIRNMMVKDPAKRFTAGEALHHRWIRNFQASSRPRSVTSRKSLSKADHDRIVASMKNFASYSKVKKTALMLVAYRSHPSETKAMRQAFTAYDVDQNGRVSRADFTDFLKKQGYTDEELVGLFDDVDDDHDGQLHYTEFLAATLETDGKKMTEERLAEAFDQLDMDDSGHISTSNLLEFLGKDCKGYNVAQLIAEADEGGTGDINLQEFSKHMRKSGRFIIPGIGPPRDTPGWVAQEEAAGLPRLSDVEEEKESDSLELERWGNNMDARVAQSRDKTPPPPPPGGAEATSITSAEPPTAPA